MSGGKILDKIEMNLRNKAGDLFPVYIDVYDSSLARKWLTALHDLLSNNYHLEKNYCFVGFADSERNGELIISEINNTIDYINNSKLGYKINDVFTLDNSLTTVKSEYNGEDRFVVNHNHFNILHRYFEELQGTAQKLSPYFLKANDEERWHIRQVNLLCHEFETWALSYGKKFHLPEWQRPSQLMCWINSPRFELDEHDFELFGIDTIARPMGAVYVGVNKAVGKHHWEVFQDEGRDSKINELITTSMRGQTLAAGDFDIEWGHSTEGHPWMDKQLNEFRD